ncbi:MULTISPECIES: ABC transporter ATP-binding protein [Catenuloplanes]|uniref:Peptide/nickel transport system ATP-binding protein n=1 Tax=Catenuloplanes niger TaxID=587534 RepID=A0AAE4CW81_9ACTN|nr:ABC transporter ATP-binding protein [Catenuloplanes niger]MDR7326950.1 peptide/nickel transport system ATP-binding protein [Catenuloplanes niger]
MSEVLEFDGVSVAFGRVRAARDVTFALRRGRVLALVGESGSGKSVTATAALGLLPPSATVTGSIRLSGEELVGAPPGVLRAVRGARIGTIFQEPMSAWNPVYTIGAQIAEAVSVHRRLGRAALRTRVLSLLSSVGLDEPDRIAASYPHQLSGGQLQRAMIAMAISGDPDVLIADEPTTALDVTVQAGILALLRGLRDTAILLITHDMGVVADLADDVVVMRAGSVVESAPAERLFDAPAHDYTRALLAAVPSLTGEFPAAPATSAAPVVSVRDLSVVYDRRVRAVDGVSLDIPAGTVVGLVGESGSGKSTIGRALAGLAPVTAGTVTVGGVGLGAASRRDLRAVRTRIGMVFQDPASALDPRRTVGDSVAEPIVLHSRATDARTRVAELLDAVRLDPSLAERYPHELSGGQRQRVVLARALALRPALLVADEPTSALDVSVQAGVLALLASLQREHGFACLFISHDLAVVRSIAHRVAVLHRGRVVEEGTTGKVLTAPEHPYTRRLLDAAPVADPRRQRARQASAS